MGSPVNAAMVATGIADRAVEPELVEQRRPELGDEAAHVAELAPQQVAQEAQLRPGEAHVLVEHALDVLDLEDRVGEAWAGPSWTSWASRERSASWASTIRIWTSVGRVAPAGSAMRLMSPRSRKSQVLSRLRWASSSLDSSRWWSPSSAARSSTVARSARSRASSAPISAAAAAPSGPEPSGSVPVPPTMPLGDAPGASRSIASRSSRRACQRASSS